MFINSVTMKYEIRTFLAAILAAIMNFQGSDGTMMRDDHPHFSCTSCILLTPSGARVIEKNNNILFTTNYKPTLLC